MKICLLGVDFNSDNKGCAALGYAAIEIFDKICQKRNQELEVFAVVFDDRPIQLPQDKNIRIDLFIVRPKQLNYWKTCKKKFDECDFVIDFTGGDSFSDIYGFKRFLITTLLKELAIFSDSLFIMGPQTIGPFNKKFTRAWGRRILNKADFCFVRDELSEQYTKEISKANPILTTDVAFALPYSKDSKQSDKIKIGINPSGLLWYSTDQFSAEKNLSLEYKEYINSVLDKLTQNDSYEVYLIPHVFSRESTKQDDLSVCKVLQKKYPQVTICSDFDTPMQAKTLISQMDIFIGARMHATIAAFSTGIATIPFSYSRKFEGLFNSLNYDYVLSGTKNSMEDALNNTFRWIEEYEILQNEVISNQYKFEEKLNIFIQAIEKLSLED